MNTGQIVQLLSYEVFTGPHNDADCLETLNSWVIRSDQYAFKIRKPQQSTGVDLSGLENRKSVCYKELELNKLLARKIYEDVVPVRKTAGNSSALQDYNAEPLDYALKMKRLDESKNILNLLKNKNINTSQINEIAAILSRFHKKCGIVRNVFNSVAFQREFEEIKRCEIFVNDLIDDEYVPLIEKSIEASRKFLARHQYYMLERDLSGYIRDGHGNLTAENIFLYGKIIITNRVVVEEGQRKMDVLFDIARLGVDLDYCRRPEYDKALFMHYLKKSGDTYTSEIQALYTYFKLFRTNLIITKFIDEITIYQWSAKQKKRIKGYFELIKRYMDAIEEM